MTELTNLTLEKARDGLKTKEFSSVELTKAHLKRMDETRDLNAFITETPELAISGAENADARLANGTAGLMEGIPVGIKDLFCTRGVKTTAASKILGDFIPPYESTVTQNLWNSGAVMLGKLNMDEFAMGSANLNSAYGSVKNPWHVKGEEKDYVPGGSSGGSAASVAAGAVMAATGTDTGGSIRQPAAFCGLVGVKPTYGLCSRWGVVAFASSLDQAGPMTKTVRDSAIMLEAMAGHDPKDATSAKVDIPSYNSLLKGDMKGLKIGIPKEYQVGGLDADIEALWQQNIAWFKENGAEIVDISLPHSKYALPSYYILAPAEASSNLSRYDGVRFGNRANDPKDLNDLYEKTRGEGFGEEVKRRIMIGTYVLSAGYYDAYFVKALKVRRLICNDFKEAYKKVDLILTPTTPTPAFAIGEEPKDPIAMYMNDVLTVTANIAGLPSMSIPAGFSSKGLPLGMQLTAPAFEETKMLDAGLFIETAAEFAAKTQERRSAS
ncbi:MAG TPA: Asp-tRNA(Asn)/Glu-tRNA(Gln) amidotransferase GatCAB subunit A [Holosporales bacterium]|nr:Asp-tRNA(Asn)/Glu-tRNA(Gln) amidotransferase GatCAB subunit A [Holosporales bacterium]